MNVRIDETGKHQRSGQIHLRHSRRCRNPARQRDGFNPLAVNQDVTFYRRIDRIDIGGKSSESELNLGTSKDEHTKRKLFRPTRSRTAKSVKLGRFFFAGSFAGEGTPEARREAESIFNLADKSRPVTVAEFLLTLFECRSPSNS